MSLFDDLKKNVSGFTENVAQKSTDAIETQKLKMQKTSLENEMKDCYILLGKLYEKNLADSCTSGSEEGNLCEKLSSIRTSIAEIEEKLREKKGVVRCPGCGRNVEAENDYCPKCGAKLDIENAAEEEPAPEDIVVDEEAPAAEEAAAADAQKTADGQA